MTYIITYTIFNEKKEVQTKDMAKMMDIIDTLNAHEQTSNIRVTES